MVVSQNIGRFLARSYKNNNCHRCISSSSWSQHSSSPGCLSVCVSQKNSNLSSPFHFSRTRHFSFSTNPQDPSELKSKFKELLKEERSKSLLGGGQNRIDRLHARGSLTARERLDLLFDEGTFHELDAFKAHRCKEFGMDEESKQFPGDGVVTGHGKVNGRYVYAFSQGVFVYTYVCVFLCCVYNWGL